MQKIILTCSSFHLFVSQVLLHSTWLKSTPAVLGRWRWFYILDNLQVYFFKISFLFLLNKCALFFRMSVMFCSPVCRLNLVVPLVQLAIFHHVSHALRITDAVDVYIIYTLKKSPRHFSTFPFLPLLFLGQYQEWCLSIVPHQTAPCHHLLLPLSASLWCAWTCAINPHQQTTL